MAFILTVTGSRNQAEVGKVRDENFFNPQYLKYSGPSVVYLISGTTKPVNKNSKAISSAKSSNPGKRFSTSFSSLFVKSVLLKSKEVIPMSTILLIMVEPMGSCL